MFNLLSLFKRKPRIIPFYTLNDDENELLEKYRELTPENKCKILSFAYRKKYLISPQLGSGYEPLELEDRDFPLTAREKIKNVVF